MSVCLGTHGTGQDKARSSPQFCKAIWVVPHETFNRVASFARQPCQNNFAPTAGLMLGNPTQNMAACALLPALISVALEKRKLHKEGERGGAVGRPTLDT